jgi:hypothetical protein
LDESCFELLGFFRVKLGGFPPAGVAREYLEGCAAYGERFVDDLREGFLDGEVYAEFEFVILA